MSAPFTYASDATPSDYVCSKCKARGCKLWRQYNTFFEHIELLCLPCAEENQYRAAELDRTDQIGSLVPAVPTEDCESYWGYTSVPDAGVQWWKRLPSAPPSKGGA